MAKETLIVSDTSPILAFLKIKRLPLMQKLFSEIVIPHTVYRELMAGSHQDEQQAISVCPFIKVKDVQSRYKIAVPPFIHEGEAEAMALAKQLTAEHGKSIALLIDDIRARKFATEQGIEIVGTIGTLKYARDIGLIESDQEIEKIIQNLKTAKQRYSKKDFDFLRSGNSQKIASKFAAYTSNLTELASAFDAENKGHEEGR